MTVPLLKIRAENESELVSLRAGTREISAKLGFENQDQTRIATALSEISREAFRQAGRVDIEYSVEDASGRQCLIIRVRSVKEIRFSPGVEVVRRLTDAFEVEANGMGTTATLRKALPKRGARLQASEIQAATQQLGSWRRENLYRELAEQNSELASTLEELRGRQEELQALNRELEDTNRGVVALYRELDERAEQLRRADQLKSTFLFHMSHEFRTPLNSITALSNILLERLDGPLTGEQDRQVRFVQKAAQELTEMVNDLLDLAKVESGIIEVQPTEWHVSKLFGALRAMLRPLVFQQGVQLVFDYAGDLTLFTDEGKLSQILRNLVSNAIKFTEQGEIRVTAYEAESDLVRFDVADTGIGIAPEDQERIFQQFAQVDSARQKKVKGTGLGLPLAKKLAELLGGRIELNSSIGAGSVFSVLIPKYYGGKPEPQGPPQDVPGSAEGTDREGDRPTAKQKVLVIDDDDATRYLVKRQLSENSIEVIEAASAAEGLKRVSQDKPDLIILDLMMPEVSGFETLEELKADERTRRIPVVIHTSMSLGERDQLILQKNASAVVRKNETDLSGLVMRLLGDLPVRSTDTEAER